MRSRNALEQLTAKGAKVQPPHVESGTPSEPATSVTDEKKEKIKKITDRATGTDDDIDAYLNTLLPEGDPIFDSNL